MIVGKKKNENFVMTERLFGSMMFLESEQVIFAASWAYLVPSVSFHAVPLDG